MTDKSEMIELARRRAGLRAAKAASKAEKDAVDTSIVYITLKDLSERFGAKVEEVRYLMRGQKPLKVPAIAKSGATGVSYAFGYTPEQVAEVFKTAGSFGATTEQAAAGLKAVGQLSAKMK